ncbi:MAG: homoserine dehydrogenase, partial [Lachnospiraceae bacterium]|nr:homoserine dehydrogenase [Lachnospiraceae bacterium]
KVREDDSLEALVAPFLVSKDHPLAMINDVFNGVFVTGNMLGDALFYGRGAGKLPTASAVVADVVDCARHPGKTVTCFWDAEPAKLADMGEATRSYLVRAKEDAKRTVEEAFGQTGTAMDESIEGEFGYITVPMQEKAFLAAYKTLGDKVLNYIRLL